ncbi:DUF3710 domain-containing protein [Actinobacteria bacterium YIM 96077]|uniref:DUF3710 domain-containing protein n=1 Tax=Phytoactinopolyspora halophila TaxID=1981511 RepID=A0A329QET1_9ACTN|nr:DUF3710 domain-containing protein [Phytoactinopolyspora halophila]AYY13426.1 DUF3710 domain-containing protein [Actinobacteria bacterium YIM 96077]RAW10820.1 DUF3710 domain-containing protein [Phytoactinopolyspora halophila]
MFRRRRRDDRDEGSETAEDEETAAASEPADPARADGPFDAAEVDIEEARRTRIDLGGLLIKGVEGMKIQLQMDKRSGRGSSALLAVGDAAVQLVAVAAPRSSGMWEQTRLQIAEDAKRRGGNVQEGSGPFGTEVRMVVPVTTKDGKQGHQPSRVSGIDGPRWMLRATFLGKAINDATAFQNLVDVVRQVVVVRGEGPMPPGEVITLTPPARREASDEVATVTDSDAASDAEAAAPSVAGAASDDDVDDPEQER